MKPVLGSTNISIYQCGATEAQTVRPKHTRSVNLPLACLSPEEIRTSITIGYVAVAFGVGATIAGIAFSLQRRDFTWLPFYVLLLALHPAWTISVYRGDCGDARRFLSGTACLVFVALLVVHRFRPQLSRQRFLLGVSAFVWLLYLPLFFSFTFHIPFSVSDDFFGHVIEAYTLSSHDIAHIALALSVACVVFWFVARSYAQRTTV